MSSPVLYPTLIQCAVVAVALKFLLLPAYKSTDFEVHRNWLATTHSLPINQWYRDTTSEWTLDYPPFFAYFEWLLSQLARWVDPLMVQVSNLNYNSWSTIAFQRTTVIVSDLLLLLALSIYVTRTSATLQIQSHAIALSVLLSPGLLIVDHIHFQYNGFLYGILILSMVLCREESSRLAGGTLFAVLLCFKHIYLYIAPAYFIFLLRVYCLESKNPLRPRFQHCLFLGVSILSVFAVALGPFAAMGQLEQLKNRLFPFARGLCHAYWAPNVWAMYSFLDRVLIVLAPYLGLTVDEGALHSVTRGLVGDTSFAVLPDVTARTCFALTLTFQVLPLTKLWMKPTWDNFIVAITLCGYSSFLFGWHVHEKAILLVILPFSLIALQDRSHLASFRPLAVAGHVSLFPLLFTEAEFPVKVVYTVCWLILFLYAFDRLAPASRRPRMFLLDRTALLYMAVSVPLMFYCSIIHGAVFGERYEFMPLMFISSYCSLGVVGSWIGLLQLYMF